MEYYFQTDNFPDIVGHPLFGLNNTHTYISVPCEYPFQAPGFPPVSDTSMESVAWNAANWIEYRRNLLRAAHPNKSFRYGLQIAGYIHKNPYRNFDDSLYNHDADAIYMNNIKYATPWHKHGINAKANDMNKFYKRLAIELKNRDIPKPDYIDLDDENTYFNNYITGDLQRDFDIIMADPRATTEKIDGLITLREYVDNFKTLSGESHPLTKWPPQYSLENYEFAHMYSSLNMRIRDYASWYANFILAKRYLGYEVACYNWYHAAASTNGPTYNVRFKESWPDYNGSSFRMEKQVWTTYGANFDLKEYDGYAGAKTFNHCKNKFGTDNGLSVEEQVRQLYLDEIEENFKYSLGSSRKPMVLSWAYADIFLGGEYVGGSGVPFKTDLSIGRKVIDLCHRYNIRVFAPFEPVLSQTLADYYVELIDYDASLT